MPKLKQFLAAGAAIAGIYLLTALSGCVPPPGGGGGGGPGPGMEWNTDRPGMNISNFNLPAANPALCRNHCNSNPSCQAWTYVKPGVQGPHPRCWLKHSVPASQYNTCCVSGVKGGGGGGGIQPNTDRPGMDLSNFNLPSANPLLCRNQCNANPSCKAWTYVKPGYQGPHPRCWLKHHVPVAQPNNCCVSGVK